MTARSTAVAQPRFGVLLQPAQDDRRELRGRVRSPAEPELELRISHVGLEEAGDLVVAEPRPLLGLLAYRRRLGAEVDHRWRDVLPVAVGDHLGPAVGVAVRHRRVGRPQVDPDKSGHALHGRTESEGGTDRDAAGECRRPASAGRRSPPRLLHLASPDNVPAEVLRPRVAGIIGKASS